MDVEKPPAALTCPPVSYCFYCAVILLLLPPHHTLLTVRGAIEEKDEKLLISPSTLQTLSVHTSSGYLKLFCHSDFRGVTKRQGAVNRGRFSIASQQLPVLPPATTVSLSPHFFSLLFYLNFGSILLIFTGKLRIN